VADPVYRPRLPLLWRIPDAMAYMGRLLPERLSADAEAGSMSLWSFLPGPEALARAGQAHATTPERALLRRSAVASTFVAGLELARQGRLALTQETLFGAIEVHDIPDLPSANQDAGADPGESALKPSSAAAR